MNEIALRNDEERGLISEIDSVWTDFKQSKVDDADAYQLAANNRKALKIYSKQLEEIKKGHTRPIDDLKAQVLTYFNTYAGKLAAALRQVDGAMLAYDAEIQRVRAEEQRKLEEYTRRKEAEEKAALEAAALNAIAKGDEARAVELVTKAEEVRHAVPVLAPVAPIAQGASFREIWKFEITDAKALPREYLIPDETRIGQVVRALKKDCSIPGVRIWSEKILATR